MHKSIFFAAGVLIPLAAAQVQSAPGKPAPKKPAAAQPATPDPVEVPDFPKLTGMAVNRAVALLQSSSATFDARKKCLSCHHQMLTAMAVDYARVRGFRVDEALAKAQTTNLAKEADSLKELLRAAESDPAAEHRVDQALVDPPMTAGYFIASLQAIGYPKSENAARFAAYLGRKQQEDGRWAVVTPRPPQQSSDFAATALAVRALKHYGETSSDTERRIAKAREWMQAHQPKTGEDRAFRLMGLAWTGAPASEVEKAVATLLDAQQDDGGWAQLDGRDTDPYATSIALVALQQAGIAANHPEYIKGVVYLVMRQKHDGSWYVPTRAYPAQQYFESGFPHKKDQFISAAATAWAVIALAPAAELPKPGSVARQ